jgi:hypothetical protein
MFEMIVTDEPHTCFDGVTHYEGHTSRVEPNYPFRFQSVAYYGEGAFSLLSK